MPQLEVLPQQVLVRSEGDNNMSFVTEQNMTEIDDKSIELRTSGELLVYYRMNNNHCLPLMTYPIYKTPAEPSKHNDN